MANMTPIKTPMPHQDPIIRAGNFEEVATGYTAEMAIDEAKRCLNCKHKPCVDGCPVNVRIPEFIMQVAEGNFAEAYKIIMSTNVLPAVTGRVCPQETQCEAKCVRGIKGEPVGIGRLERFVADYAMANDVKIESKPEPNGHKVAIVGSGPAGLSCAGELIDLGYQVSIFEALHIAGGVLSYGIPEFRLPKTIVNKEVNNLIEKGAHLRTDFIVGRTQSVDDLFEQGFDAVFVGSGAGLPSFMNIPGESLLGVYSANEYLTRTNLMKAYLKDSATPIFKGNSVAVVGGGNVAMDAARCAKRMGAEKVYIVYRRSADEMPARAEEVEHAGEEGIIFQLLTNPLEIIGNEEGKVCGMKCVQMELGEADASGRRRPVAIEGSEFVLDVDTVVMSIGTSPNPLIKDTTPGIEVNKWGCLVTDDNLATTREGVYGGGDAVSGAATVILAMGAGKQAAQSIHKFIQEKNN